MKALPVCYIEAAEKRTQKIDELLDESNAEMVTAVGAIAHWLTQFEHSDRVWFAMQINRMTSIE